MIKEEIIALVCMRGMKSLNPEAIFDFMGVLFWALIIIAAHRIEFWPGLCISIIGAMFGQNTPASLC